MQHGFYYVSSMKVFFSRFRSNENEILLDSSVKLEQIREILEENDFEIRQDKAAVWFRLLPWTREIPLSTSVILKFFKQQETYVVNVFDSNSNNNNNNNRTFTYESDSDDEVEPDKVTLTSLRVFVNRGLLYDRKQSPSITEALQNILEVTLNDEDEGVIMVFEHELEAEKDTASAPWKNCYEWIQGLERSTIQRHLRMRNRGVILIHLMI